MDCVIHESPNSVTVMQIGSHKEVTLRFNQPPGDGAREFSGVCRRCNTTETIHRLNEIPCLPAPTPPPAMATQADGHCT
ncbi:hypothetical protein KGQ24_00890 [Patescibacteria group bacterium]|nr:hypothetical protein [Patescibacteria group bacterium]